MTNKLEWEKKIWGKCLHVFNSEHAAVSYLVVNEGFQCSRHYHRYRANQFTVISGRILIEEWYSNGNTKVYDLLPGESHTVDSKVEHRFIVLGSGQFIEVYWPIEGKVVDINDIVRIDEGGPVKEEK